MSGKDSESFRVGWRRPQGSPGERGCLGSQEGVWDAVQEAEGEKEMATHSSIVAWETPWTEECFQSCHVLIKTLLVKIAIYI